MPRTIFQGENTIIKPYDSVNIFNNFFVAETGKQKLKWSQKQVLDYLKHQCDNSICFQSTASEEIANISPFNMNKSSSGSHSPPL